MRIAIFGSWRAKDQSEWGLTETPEAFAAACQALGRAVGSYRQSVIVSSPSERTADPHVVHGLVSVLHGTTSPYPAVRVTRRSGAAHPFKDLAATDPALFTYSASTQSSKEGARLLSVKDAEAVLTIGGSASTYHTGFASILAGKIVVPIGSFGGGSRRLLDTLCNELTPKNREPYEPLYGPWSDFLLDKIMTALGVSRQPRLLIIHGRTNDNEILQGWLQRTLGISDVRIMGQQFGDGKTLPEKFEELAEWADAAIAIATPDDIGGLAADTPETYEPRARENVWLEIGWFWGRLGRQRAMILRKGHVRIPSDLSGLEVYNYNDKPQDRSDEIRAFMDNLKH